MCGIQVYWLILGIIIQLNYFQTHLPVWQAGLVLTRLNHHIQCNKCTLSLRSTYSCNYFLAVFFDRFESPVWWNRLSRFFEWSCADVSSRHESFPVIIVISSISSVCIRGGTVSLNRIRTVLAQSSFRLSHTRKLDLPCYNGLLKNTIKPKF